MRSLSISGILKTVEIVALRYSPLYLISTKTEKDIVFIRGIRKVIGLRVPGAVLKLQHEMWPILLSFPGIHVCRRARERHQL